MRGRDLRLRMLPVQVEMARTWMASLPIGGTVTGSVTVNGSTTTQLAVEQTEMILGKRLRPLLGQVHDWLFSKHFLLPPMTAS